MDKEKTIKVRLKLIDFLDGQNRVFEFEVDPEPSERVNFIYNVIFSGFRKVTFYVRYIVARIAQYIDCSPLKVLLYRLIGMRIGKGVFISPDVILDPHFPTLIAIEDHAILGWGAKLFTHEFSGSKYRIGRIVIQEGAVIGGFSTIRGGVTIGKMAEIPYGSIVYKDVAANTKAEQVIIRQLKENV
jgi:acetyltransferase-like isoleucine patch superfamily enzyme